MYEGTYMYRVRVRAPAARISKHFQACGNLRKQKTKLQSTIAIEIFIRVDGEDSTRVLGHPYLNCGKIGTRRGSITGC